MVRTGGRSTRTVRGACPHDCPDTCAWKVSVEEGEAVKLVGDPDHPFTQGALCAKVSHYLERVYSPSRLLFPLKRTGSKGQGAFKRVSWATALNGIATRLKQVMEEAGPTAVLPYSYMGTQGLIQGLSMDRRFFARLGASRLDRTICGSTGGAGLVATLGTYSGTLPQDVVHSRFIILWGTNTIVTNLHLWPLIRKAQASGAKVVAIDPVKTRTADSADWHIRPMPGTDGALALGMMHVIVEEGLYDDDYVGRYTLGFRRLRERLGDYPPQRVARLTGLESRQIVRLAREYATTRPSLIRTLVGMEHHANGAMTLRTIACLPGLVGAWRDQGGGLLHMTWSLHVEALNMNGLVMPELAEEGTRTINMIQLGKALTDPSLDPPIQALIVYNSNPATIAPNQNLVLKGLKRRDLFTVVLEQFLTDTARYADYVLPATTQVEHWDLLPAWGHTYLTLNQPAIAPLGEALPNTEIFRRLAAHMGFDDPYLRHSDEDLIRTALASDHPHLRGITFERLVKEGWAPLTLPEDGRPFAKGGFPTPSGRCEFYAEALAEDGMDPLPSFAPPLEGPVGDAKLAARYPLALLTAKSAVHFLNSSYANLPRHLNAEREPLLLMHPRDAAERGIADGDRIRVFNGRGEARIRIRVEDRVRPGVVSMPSGWWASLSPGGTSANALTSDGLSDLGGGGIWHDTMVEVTRLKQSGESIP